MKYELKVERVDQIAQPLSELQGVVSYLAYAGHPHLTTCITLRRLNLDLYCDNIAEMNACIVIAKRYLKSDWRRNLTKGHVDGHGKYYCISYTFYTDL